MLLRQVNHPGEQPGEWIDCEGVRVYSGRVLADSGSDQLAVEIRVNDKQAQPVLRLIFSANEATGLQEALAVAVRNVEWEGKQAGSEGGTALENNSQTQGDTI